MATKSERFRAEEERRKAITNATTDRAAPDPTTNESERARKKATYAFEESSGPRRSRKSTRKSANRAKPDAAMTIREELRKDSPKERHSRETTRS